VDVLATEAHQSHELAAAFADLLAGHGYGPFYGTPCGILAPLYGFLEQKGLVTVPREDNAVGIAAGAALSGRYPVVLMQNSGFGNLVNALASLVVPYEIPMILMVGLRGTQFDNTAENAMMGKLTEPILAGLGIAARPLPERVALSALLEWLDETVKKHQRTAAVLIHPCAFGWSP
jgi:sulfopyruvate decarboxylase subunit alpha